MGLIEQFSEIISIKAVGGIAILAYALWFAIVRYDEHRRIQRLGGYGTAVPTWAPWSIDLVWGMVKAAMAQDNIQHWRDVFNRAPGGYTSDVRVLGRRTIFTAEPENIKAILALQFSDYGKGEPFHREWKDFLGDSIFTTDGAQWHDSRQLIRPQFTRDRVSDLHCFESHVQTLYRCIDNLGPLYSETQQVPPGAGNGKVLDISDLFFRYTLDVATEFLLGQDTKSLTSIQNDFADAFNEVQRVQSILSRAAKIQAFIPKASFWAGLKLVDHFINTYIDRTLRLSPGQLQSQTKGDQDYSFLHALAGFTRDPKVLRDQIIAVLLAGRDTTAGTLSWAVYELARTPHAVKKLRSEILSTIGPDKAPDYETLKNMPYLRAIINETLRLYPSVPYNIRLALKDTTLPTGGGADGKQPIGILKDTPIAYSTIVMQRRPDLYPPVSEKFLDPAVFSPERWEVWHPKPHDYIPFNAGPRICVGQQFAITEMGYVLSRLFQKYERVESAMFEIDGGNPRLQADIVLSPGQGVKVAFFEPGS